MARSDLLLTLVKAGINGDQALFRKTVEAIIAEEHSKQHHVLADRLADNLRVGNSKLHNGTPLLDNQTSNLLLEKIPSRTLSELILPNVVREACEELLEEHNRVELLRSYNLEPRHRVLLAGPPGNGKTTLAEAIAEALMVPLLVVRYEGIIGSYLGETAIRLKRMFEYVRTRKCVLFLDEFDVLGKERGDVHETGEIKRVVSSLLMQIDTLPSHVIVITATNHPELLDKAVWRRFQLRWQLPQPGIKELEEWFIRFEKRLGQSLGYEPRLLADKLKGLSFAEIEDFGYDVLRRFVLNQPTSNVRSIVSQRLKQWKTRFKLPEDDKR